MTDPTVAACHLDAIADRIEALMRRERQRLPVSAAGDDEVSRRVGQTLNRMAEEFLRSADHGVVEIRRMAETLRPSAEGGSKP